jgi:ElaB/YqjD/DUF883 family membrane-anchored ribosome-binding protein
MVASLSGMALSDFQQLKSGSNGPPSWPGAKRTVSVKGIVSLKEVLLKEMATGKKGSGSAARRRIRSAVKEAAATMQETNGAAHQGAAINAEITNPETIRARAYELFLARGARHGDDLADWFNAERELRAVRNL